MAHTRTIKRGRAPVRPLPLEPSALQLEDFAAGLAANTGESVVSYGWLRETTMALPLPTPQEKLCDLEQFIRHIALTQRIVKMRDMLAWLTQDIREYGFWKYPAVNCPLKAVAENLTDLLVALEAEAGRDRASMTAEEENAVDVYYARAHERFVL